MWATTRSQRHAGPAACYIAARCSGSRGPRPTSWCDIRRGGHAPWTSAGARPPELDGSSLGRRALGARDGLRRSASRAMLRIAARDLGGARAGGAEIGGDRRRRLIIAEALELARRAATGSRSSASASWVAPSSTTPATSTCSSCTPRRDRAARPPSRRPPPSTRCSPSPPPRASRSASTALRPGGRAGALSRRSRRRSSTTRRLGHVGAPGADQGPARRRRRARRVFVRGVTPFVYPEDAPPAAIEDVRQVKVRLEEYVRAARQGGHRRSSAVVAGSATWSSPCSSCRSCTGAETIASAPNTLAALAALANEGYVARGDADAPRRRVPVPADARAPPPDGARPADARPARRPRAHGSRARWTSDGPRRCAAYERQTGVVRGAPRAAVLPAAAGGVRRPARRGRASTGPPPRSCSAASGSADPARSYEVLRPPGGPSPGSARCSRTSFPVMAPPSPFARAPTRRSSGWSGSPRGRLGRARVADPRGRSRRRLAGSRTSWARARSPPTSARRAGSGCWRSRTAALDDAQASSSARSLGRAARELDPPRPGAALAAVAIAWSARRSRRGPAMPFAVIGLGKLGARGSTSPPISTCCSSTRARGRTPSARRRRGRAGPRRHPRRRDGSPTPTSVPRAAAGRSPARSPPTSSTGSGTRRRGSSRRCCGPGSVAGDEALGRRFCSFAADFAYPESCLANASAEIRRMRERMEREACPPGRRGRFHFKLGYGSLADVQFAVELALMRHGRHRPDVRRRGPWRRSRRSPPRAGRGQRGPGARGGLRVPQRGQERAGDGPPRPAEAIPPSPQEQVALARRLGYEEYPRQTFLDDYLRITRRARRAMERVFRDVQG